MRVIVLLTFLACFTGASPGAERSLDPHLTQRAGNYFRALELGNYRRLWDDSSSRLRTENGGDIEEYVARLEENRPYELSVKLVVGWSNTEKGEVFVRIQTRDTRASEPDVTEYLSRWVLEDGDWMFDDMLDIPVSDYWLQDLPRAE